MMNQAKRTNNHFLCHCDNCFAYATKLYHFMVADELYAYCYDCFTYLVADLESKLNE